MNAVMYTDGGARPTNPGFAGFAAVVKVGKHTHSISRYLGPRHTNNFAEFVALLVGAKYAFYALGIRSITCVCDSKLVVETVNGNWQIKEDSLRPLCHEIKRFMDASFNQWSVEHVERAKNAEADAVCTNAILWGRSRNPWVPERVRQPKGEVVDPFGYGEVLVKRLL